MRRLAAAAAVLALLAAGAVTLASSSEADTLSFSATFDTPADFYGQFDYGYSGQASWNFGDAPDPYSGDHAATDPCGSATSSRSIHLSGSGTNVDTSGATYWCAPTGAASGHVMTAIDTTGYNIGWFSPKSTFTDISKVCWDINETELSHRKWTQVLFVGAADAVRYPAGTPTYPGGVGYARGSGGFDLGYVSPEFFDPNGATTRIISPGGSVAGVKVQENAPQWFQGGDFTTKFEGPGNILDGITDKATRYQMCVTNQANGTVLFSQQTPGGSRSFTLQGQIPQDARRVVFEDDNYDPQKGTGYNPANLTWHWDNIQVFTAAGPPPTTSTVAPTTTAATTTAPSTTVASTTTTGASTTAVADPCPASFDPEQHAWCETIEARLAALGG